MKAGRKNILVVFNDDHGAWAVGAYGNRQVHSPSIDHLASTGVVMLNAFTPTPVCSPARACFLTGRLASQHGLHDYLEKAPEFHTRRWIDHERTLAQIYSDAGYRVGLSGKWHLGNDETPHPGFDSWFALDGSYPINQRGEHHFSVDGRIERLSGYKTQIITDRAIKFLREQSAEQPFFLFVGYTATHSPWADHPERLVDQFRRVDLGPLPSTTYPYGRQTAESAQQDHANWREMLAQYYASIAGLDEGVGRLTDELDALGLRDDTLVLYTSDHGLCAGHHGIWGKSNSTIPINFVEEAIRIPMIVNGPGLFAGQRRTEFVDHLDMFQTLLDYTLGEPDASEAASGRSFLPLLNASAAITDWRNVQFCEYGNVRMIRTPRFKLVQHGGSNRLQLFDLHDDPGEVLDVAVDPAQREVVSELSRRLDAHFTRYEHPERTGRRIHDLPRPNSRNQWA